MNRRAPSLILLATLAACSHDAGPGEAMQTFDAFQKALQGHDEAGCRRVLTVESAAALLEIPWQDVKAQQPLQVLGAEREQNEFRVQVADPNNGGARAEFVVVREYGRLVVDLVASAGLTARIVEAPSSREQLEPRALTPADYDRIREYELAQPPR